MQFEYPELFGYAAAAASLYAANSKTIIPLRFAAIAANVLAMFYSASHGTLPTFLLNGVLLPVNAWRLHLMRRLIHDVVAATNTDVNVDWLLPYMSPKQFKAGHVLLREGDIANEAYYIASGDVELGDGRVVGKGTLLGEIGLFTADGRRTMTARCKTDVQAASITYDQFKELYFQNPQFGFYLLRLVVTRLHHDELRHAAQQS